MTIPRLAFVVSHTHWDREWYLPFHRFRVMLVDAVEKVLDRLEDDEGGSIERLETIDQEEYLRRTGKLSRPAAELRDLSIDLGRVIASLPPELRTLCQRLQTESVTEISRDTGIPRGTIYESIKKLRAIFEDAGLRDYL